MPETKFTPGPWSYRPMRFDDWGYVRGPAEADMVRAALRKARGEV